MQSTHANVSDAKLDALRINEPATTPHNITLRITKYLVVMASLIVACGVMVSVAEAGPRGPGQSCTAGKEYLGCSNGVCLGTNGLPEYRVPYGGGYGAGKCYPPGVPFGTYEKYSPTLQEIAEWMPQQFVKLDRGIQSWYPVQIQAIQGPISLMAAIIRMNPNQIQALTPPQRQTLVTELDENQLTHFLSKLTPDQRKALGNIKKP